MGLDSGLAGGCEWLSNIIYRFWAFIVRQYEYKYDRCGPTNKRSYKNQFCSVLFWLQHQRPNHHLIYDLMVIVMLWR